MSFSPQRLRRRQLHSNKRHLRLKSIRLGYLLDECQTTLRYSVELRCTSQSEFSLNVMFPTDFGEPAALQLRHVIRMDDFGRDDVLGVRQVLSSASGATDLCFMKSSFDILVASLQKIIPYCFPPIDSTVFSPERSTKTLPCFLSDRHSLVFFTGALNPFAVEHPTHGSSFTPGFSLTPCCLADSLSRRGWVWAVVRWYWLISTSVVGRSPRAITARAHVLYHHHQLCDRMRCTSPSHWAT